MVLKVTVHVETSIDESISLQKPPADLGDLHGCKGVHDSYYVTNQIIYVHL